MLLDCKTAAMIRRMPELLVARDRETTTLTLNRPERLNAVTQQLYSELIAALADADSDKTVRAVILTGSGRAFCVGADLKNHGDAKNHGEAENHGEAKNHGEAAGGDGQDREARNRHYAQFGQDAAAAIMQCTKPVIAAINGHAIGAGLELALACDLSVVADVAKLRFPELSLGTFVGGGTTITLLERVGMTRAKSLLLLGRFFKGADAADWGLCNECTPTEEVMPNARKMAQEVAAMAPRSVAAAKQLLRQAHEQSMQEALAAEAAALASCMGTSDWQEGIDAFRDKRRPNFNGY